MIADAELRRLFRAESGEHLARLDDGLLRLEGTPADPALLEEVFRESHSLKGAARMLGLSRIELAAHGFETILNAARKGESTLTPATVEHLNAALVDLRRHVAEALADEASAGAPAAPAAAARMPGAAEPAASPPLRPAAAAAPAGEAALAPREQRQSATDAEPFHIETVRVETRRLDELMTQAGELAVIRGQAQHRRALLDELQEQWAALERGRTQEGARRAAAQRFGHRLKQARDALVDDAARLAFTAGQVEERVRNMRLLPLSTLFALFPRMVRDLARTLGKEVALTIEGGDIAVDKRILEEMKDPLMHLVRNAVDHGIEPPDERERTGKPRCGTIRLGAARENADVLIEVRDDGRGLDAAAIHREAGRQRLADDKTLAAMTPEQLQQLVFQPGFSTSVFVTELSGRGVGLDVVRINVERLKGGIRLESAPGKGLTVRLRMPLSLATARLLLARAGRGLYGLPVDCVHAAWRLRESEVFALEGRPAVLFDGQPTMVARLADLLELPAEPEGKQPDVACCVLIELENERLGLLADDLPAEEEVVPKPLGAPLRRVRNVAALAMLGSGEICAVLNPADLMRSARRSGQVARRSFAAERAPARPAVLLAEDSALIRAMEKRILEDAGYEVTTAVDGIDALNALASRSFAAVVTDIVMPNMDGLTLTGRIRADPRCQALPVILVTTLASDEDKRRGLEAGANAYLPKPTFDQRVLLDTLKRLI